LEQVNTIIDYTSVLYKDLFPEVGGVRENKYFAPMTEEEINEEIGKEITRRYKWLVTQVKTNIAKDMMSGYAEDLLHHIIIDLYKKTPEYKLDLLNNKKVENWILVACGFQLRSGSSPFYREHRQLRMSARSGMLPDGFFEEDTSLDDLYQCLLKAMEHLDVYQRTLIQRKYFDKWTYDEICDYYQISKTHLTKDTKIAIKKIREYCNNVDLDI
jgi:RNA polymerase sigma factor (sigma-70 family)